MSTVVALEAKGASKAYRGGILALDDLDLRIESGTTTALVGPNGAGKSTLIRAWVGFERLSRGSVTVGGVDPIRSRDTALEMLGYVPQSTALYRELTVADHIALVHSLRRGFDPGYASRRLDDLGIPLARPAGELSGGQQAQVQLALALATGAEVLLLDEPLASLDPLARREFLHVLTDAIIGSGRTAVLSSHVVTDIEQACDHLVILGAGRLLLHQSITEALAEHAIMGANSPALMGAGGEGRIGSFFDPRGGLLTLVRHPLGPIERPRTNWRPATLEEVVLGYLAAAKANIETGAVD